MKITQRRLLGLTVQSRVFKDLPALRRIVQKPVRTPFRQKTVLGKGLDRPAGAAFSLKEHDIRGRDQLFDKMGRAETGNTGADDDHIRDFFHNEKFLFIG